MIKKIVFDGHDGVGKSTRIEEMKKLNDKNEDEQ